ncbi:MAG: hypothetical protein AB1546_05975 [bacterium]
MKFKIKYLNLKIFIYLLVIFFVAEALYAAEAGRTKRVVIVVADRLDIHDVIDPSLKNWQTLLNEGAIGLMNTRTLERNDPVAACATVGAGVRAIGTKEASLAVNVKSIVRGRIAGDIYTSRTGELPPPDGIVNLGTASLAEANSRTTWRAQPGALGTALHEFGFNVAVIGNSDTDEHFHREAMLMVMDKHGKVPAGDISVRNYIPDPKAPFGFAADLNFLKEKFMEFYLKNHVIVIDFGETARVDYFRTLASDDGYRLAKQKAVRELDDFLGFLLRAVDRDYTLVMVLVPTPYSRAQREEQTLTPLLLIGDDIVHGLLTSASTRRQGLVTNMDVAPTVLSYFDIPVPPFMLGAQVKTIARKQPLSYILKFYNKDAFTESHSGFIKAIIYFQLVVLVLAYLTAVRLGAMHSVWLHLMQWVILTAAGIDLAVLLVAPVDATSMNAYLIAVLAMLGVITGLVSLVPGAALRMASLAFLYFLCLAVEQLLGAPLSRESMLGYYPQIGARYYGIGNEYMGFLISAPIVFGALMLDMMKGHRLIKILVAALFGGVLLVVASPGLGANVGGLISCGFAFLWMVWTMRNGRMSLRSVLLLILVVAVLVAAFAFYDFSGSGGDASHLGRMVMRVKSEGWNEFFTLASRKIGTNLRLLMGSSWSALFAILGAVALAVYYFPIERVEKIFTHYVYFRRGFVASLVGAGVAFLANDSGIVPGATCLILPLAALFIILFAQHGREQKVHGA